ncbi:hypothetical protein V8D89_015221 [Ganoderma adspersum]
MSIPIPPSSQTVSGSNAAAVTPSVTALTFRLPNDRPRGSPASLSAADKIDVSVPAVTDVFALADTCTLSDILHQRALAPAVAFGAGRDPGAKARADTHTLLTQAEPVPEIELQASESTLRVYLGSCKLGALSTVSIVRARYMAEGERRGGSMAWGSGSTDITPSWVGFCPRTMGCRRWSRSGVRHPRDIGIEVNIIVLFRRACTGSILAIFSGHNMGKEAV